MARLNFQTTDEKVTREMASQNDLLFLPENEKQAVYVQKRLLEMGFIWANKVRGIQCVDECVANGIVLKGQRIYFLSTEDKAEGYKFCRLEQLDPGYVAPRKAPAPLPQDTVIEMFRQVSDRLTAIEKRLTDIESQLAPKKQDKPLRRPQPPR